MMHIRYSLSLSAYLCTKALNSYLESTSSRSRIWRLTIKRTCWALHSARSSYWRFICTSYWASRLNSHWSTTRTDQASCCMIRCRPNACLCSSTRGQITRRSIRQSRCWLATWKLSWVCSNGLSSAKVSATSIWRHQLNRRFRTFYWLYCTASLSSKFIDHLFIRNLKIKLHQ